MYVAAYVTSTLLQSLRLGRPNKQIFYMVTCFSGDVIDGKILFIRYDCNILNSLYAKTIKKIWLCQPVVCHTKCCEDAETGFLLLS